MDALAAQRPLRPQLSVALHQRASETALNTGQLAYNRSEMTDADRYRREQEFRQLFERQLPDFARMCADSVEVVIFHQDAFAADYQQSEFCLLGRAVKYAGLLGKQVQVIGRNSQTLGESANH
jgi:hypothetical protein